MDAPGDSSASEPLDALGLMSGTSMDGVDVALVRTDGERIDRLGPESYLAYSDDERAILRRALVEAAGMVSRGDRAGVLAEAEAVVTDAHARAVELFLRANPQVRPQVVGFHGQTVLHRPHAGLTVQLGDGHALARRLGIPVVFDFRAADVEAGGEGAPLVPVVHRALARMTRLQPPLAILNIGGVANLTYVGPQDDLVAFDTGPGNALIDDFMRARRGAACDLNGHLAAQGEADRHLLAQLMGDAFFERRPPKSLDRNAFPQDALAGLGDADGAATLTAFTVESVARGMALLPDMPLVLVLAGGGAHNPTLVKGLKARMNIPVRLAGDVGWSGDALEAQAFAVLAVRSLRGLPLSFPGTTGVPRPLTGGVLAEP